MNVAFVKLTGHSSDYKRVYRNEREKLSITMIHYSHVNLQQVRDVLL